MIKKILDLLEQKLAPQATAQDREHQLKLASASLLVEMIRMDHVIEAAEQQMVKQLLQTSYKLNDEETDSLFALAEEESHNAVDYYRFAKLINAHYSQPQKILIIENLWQIANADGVINKYEEHYLRKVADLLHVPHKDFIRTKHRVLDSDAL
jgi:uncharacterized tellurite resistance protein B-like protein